VADFHRTLLKGGVFLYPPNKAKAGGKCRLLYEANPLAFIAEQAGGMASNGTGRIMEIKRQRFISGRRYCGQQARDGSVWKGRWVRLERCLRVW